MRVINEKFKFSFSFNLLFEVLIADTLKFELK